MEGEFWDLWAENKIFSESICILKIFRATKGHVDKNEIPGNSTEMGCLFCDYQMWWVDTPNFLWELLFSESKATLTLDWDIRELLRAIWKEKKQGRLGSDGKSKAERFGAQAVASATWVSSLIFVFPCDG